MKTKLRFPAINAAFVAAAAVGLCQVASPLAVSASDQVIQPSFLKDLHIEQKPMVQGFPDRGDADSAKSGEGLQISAAFDRADAKYRHGESLSFTVETSEDAYIWVFDTGTSGKTHQIFPNRHETNNFLKAGVPVAVPHPDASYKFVVSHPAGTELLTVIASKDNAPLTQDLIDSEADAGPVFALRGTAVSVVKDLAVSLKKHPRWVKDQRVFYVE
jgi:hypothetical protein